MFENIGGLKNHWHIIALSQELNKVKILKRKFYNIPLIIYKDTEDAINVFIDFCPHKKAPLHVNNNELVCSYHGWKFFNNGNLKEIPSSPHLKGTIQCSLKKICCVEKEGFIWILPNYKKEGEENKIPNISEKINQKWNNYFTSGTFETNDDLLIENFMDSTHTPIVHNGLIRTNKTKTKHFITIQQEENTIKAIFDETHENVGLGINFFIGNKLKISHIDEFIPPNFIKVTYTINGKDRFQAFIACTPGENDITIGFFKISYNFGFLGNIIFKMILPFVAQKVLKQDFDITKAQFENINCFSKIPDIHIDYDLLHNKVKILKSNIKNNTPGETNNSANNINIYV